ncbi:hypothetical protein EGT07_13355 [Herbaspirillum sp. HC18]|nr:hypothetical protein EGT07_13355 [Herbaspirillum sp. HC18]
MSVLGGHMGFGGRRVRREVVDIPERKVEDRSLDKLLHVRKQRIGRLERERNEAREMWRTCRDALHQAKTRWRTALKQAGEFWREAREDFFKMQMTSGEIRRAKATYTRMKVEASELRLACGEYVKRSKEAGTEFFEARKRVMDANKQQEKLTILRDEIKLMTQQSEM